MSGIPGGIFAPSLAIGAGFGANLARSDAGSFHECGDPARQSGAYFAGVVQAPITAFVIVMTDNHAMILALMGASFIACGVSRLICLYTRRWRRGFLRVSGVRKRPQMLRSGAFCGA